ncbi:cytochrome P450 [Aspergillus navahoensis]
MSISINPAIILLYPPLLFLIGRTIAFLLNTLRPKSFPPGPRGHIGLGNYLQINKRFPFLSYGAWAQTYGKDTPLGIKRVAYNVVVLNSARLVRELFERRGAIYSDRPWQFMNHTWIYSGDMREAIFENNGAWLTKWRKEFNNHFGPAAITRLRPVYEAETARLLVKLLKLDGPVNERSSNAAADLEAILLGWLMSVPSLGVCGRRLDTMDDLGLTPERFKECTDEYAAVAAPTIRDLLPVLRYVPEVFGMAGWKKRARAVRRDIMQMGTKFVIAAEQQRAALDTDKSAIGWESMLARMLKEQREKGEDMFTVMDMGNTACHVVAAAMNTSLSVFSIMLLILAKHRDVQDRVRKEVLEVSGGRAPKAANLPSLKYTEAFWNEVIAHRISILHGLRSEVNIYLRKQVHRWRPVAPQGVPHAPSRDDVYNGHRIPRGTTMIMNVWQIHHSPEDYDSPDEFIPERFLQHPFGMRPDQAHDAAHLESASARVTYDFGAGRRICPGMHSAKQSLLLGLAKVLWAFDVLPPEGREIDLSLETGFVQDIALHPKEFDVVFRLREGRTRGEVLDHYEMAYEGEAEVMGWKDGLYK